mgnify:CR=1 FL=1
MKTAACLVNGIVEFSACMESGEYQTLRGDALGVEIHGDAPAVIADGAGAVML